jgi:hypothetical protein
VSRQVSITNMHMLMYAHVSAQSSRIDGTMAPGAVLIVEVQRQ